VYCFSQPAFFHLYLSVWGNFTGDGTKSRNILFTALSAFFGSQLLGKLPVPGIFRVFLLAICLIMVIATLLSFKWKVSEHLLALGGFLGSLLALNFKYGMNVFWLIVVAVLVSGIVGTSRLYLEKESQTQVYAGFFIGLGCMFVLLFI
jgi:hypothetical protein